MTDQFQDFDYTQGLNDNAAFPSPPTFQSGTTESPNVDAKQDSPEDANAQRGGSEEEDLTPAQSRRKAQNRAAYVSIYTVFV